MTPALSKKLKEQFVSFLETHSPQQFSASLRTLLLEYMREQVKIGFHPHFDKFLWAMDDLFQLLDTAAAEQQEHPPESGKK